MADERRAVNQNAAMEHTANHGGARIHAVREGQPRGRKRPWPKDDERESSPDTWEYRVIAKNQNTFAKRQREMEKKRKQEEKRQRRTERKSAELTTSSDPTEETAEEETAEDEETSAGEPTENAIRLARNL
jgi:hypothetical protein